MAEPVDTGKRTPAGRIIWNDGGQDYSERTTTVKASDGRFYTIPTVDEKGKQPYNDDLLVKYIDKYGPIDFLTGEKLPAFKTEKEAVMYAKERSKTRKGMQKGGLTETEQAFNLDAEGRRRRADRPKPEPKSKHPLETLPFFQRPPGSSVNDRQIGTDDAGNPVFETMLRTRYTIKVNPDQRTLREKITEAIPTVKKTIRDYLKDPKAPSPEQVIDFGKGIVQGYLETIKDVTEGKGTMGDVFGLVGGKALATTPFKVPEGAIRTFGGKAIKMDEGEFSNFQNAKKMFQERASQVDVNDYGLFYPINKDVWNKTGWFIDPIDKQWRYEINDKKASFDYSNKYQTSKEVIEEIETIQPGRYFFSKLPAFFKHDELYKRYPFLKKLKVDFYNKPKSKELGFQSPGSNTISLNVGRLGNVDGEKFKSTLLHEIQHVIQEYEGFSPGANSDYIPDEATQKLVKRIQSDKIKATAQIKLLENNLSSILPGATFQLLKSYLPSSTLKEVQERASSPFILKPEAIDFINDRDEKKIINTIFSKTIVTDNSAAGDIVRELVENHKLILDADDLQDNMEFKFYQGAGGEIESRLVQKRKDLSLIEQQEIFPLDTRALMLGYDFPDTPGSPMPRIDPKAKEDFIGAVDETKEVVEQTRKIKPGLSDAYISVKPIEDFLPEDHPRDPVTGEVEFFSTDPKVRRAMLRNKREAENKRIASIFKGFPELKKLTNLKFGDGLKFYGKEDYRGAPVKDELDDFEDIYIFSKYRIDRVKKGSLPSNREFIFIDDKDAAIARDLTLAKSADELFLPVISLQTLDSFGSPQGEFVDVDLAEFIKNTNLVKKPFDTQKLIKRSEDKKGGFFSKLKGKIGLAEGGEVMNRQMEMAFMQQGGLKDDGMKVDPVSGNQIPPGSMAKEVRDDIPAQLSEGEYVVPADVVQYYGVKHFENLRNKAKSGLQQMERDGRIGGEPVPVGGPKAMAMGGPLSGEEVQELQRMANGGMVQMTDPYQQQKAMYQQPQGMSNGGATREFVTRSGPGFGRPIYTGEFSFEKPGAGAFQPPQEKTTVTLYGPQGDSIVLTMPDDQDRYNDLISRGYTTTPPKPVQQPTGGGDGGGSRFTPEPKDPWYKEVDFNNVSGYVNNILETQQTPGIFGFTTPVLNLITSVDRLGNVSKAFSSIELAKAAGKIGEDEYKRLRNKVNGYAKDNNLDPKIVNNIASGAMRTSNVNRLADDDDDGTTTRSELEDWMDQNTSTTKATPTTPKPKQQGDGSNNKGGKQVPTGQGGAFSAPRKVAIKGSLPEQAAAKAEKEQQAAGRTESIEQKIKRGGGFNKGGLMRRKKNK